MRSEKDVIVVVVVVVLGVAFICFPVVVSSSLLVNQVVVAFSVFLVILIDAIIDKIVDVKHTVKIFITFRSFFPLFPFAVAIIFRNRGAFFVQFR